MCEAFLELYRPAHHTASETLLKYVAQYWTYGIYGFIKEWLRNDCSPGVDEMYLVLDKAVSTSTDFMLSAG